MALSKPPWFTALAIWRIGDSWGGNCCFISDSLIGVSEGINEIEFEGKLKKGITWTNDRSQFPDDSSKDVTLILSEKSDLKGNEYSRKSKISGLEIVVRTEPLKEDYHIVVLYRDESMIFDNVHESSFDNKHRVVLTLINGKILRLSVVQEKLHSEEVFDLSDMPFRAIKAPESATKW